jgi:catalase (peroxidase I)
MLTTDLAMAYGDAEYSMLVKEYSADLNSLTTDFGKAWYQLMSRDHGNRQRCLGDELPPIQSCKSFF